MWGQVAAVVRACGTVSASVSCSSCTPGQQCFRPVTSAFCSPAWSCSTPWFRAWPSGWCSRCLPSLRVPRRVACCSPIVPVSCRVVLSSVCRCCCCWAGARHSRDRLAVRGVHVAFALRQVFHGATVVGMAGSQAPRHCVLGRYVADPHQSLGVLRSACLLVTGWACAGASHLGSVGRGGVC